MRRNKLSPKQIKAIYKDNVRKAKYDKLKVLDWNRINRLLDGFDLKISDNAEEEYNQHRVAKYGK